MTRLMRSPAKWQIWKVTDPPEAFLFRWLWRLRRHNQRKKEVMGRSSLPKPHHRITRVNDRTYAVGIPMGGSGAAKPPPNPHPVSPVNERYGDMSGYAILKG